MKRILQALALSTAILSTGNVASAQTPATATKPAATKPATAVHTANNISASKPASKPGWVVVKEWVLGPLYREPHKHLAETTAAFRRGEERKAAEELGKAISWLRLTDARATVEGRYQLVKAREKLEKIEADLKKGSLVDADQLSKGIAAAYYAIANEHYLKAQESRVGSTVNKDSNESAKHIIAAGLYLQEAARSAEHEFGKDINESLKVLDAKGKELGKLTEVDQNFIADNLKHIGRQQPVLQARSVLSTRADGVSIHHRHEHRIANHHLRRILVDQPSGSARLLAADDDYPHVER